MRILLNEYYKGATDYSKTIIVGAMFFSEANQDVIKKADQEGLLLLQVPENPDDIDPIEPEQLIQKNSTEFQLARFPQES